MKALIVVDVQNDFCPGGALAVPSGDAVVEVANRVMRAFALVVATQDWHPPDHGSFAANHPGKNPFETSELFGMPQVLWPVHCVQGTPGAAFHPDLEMQCIRRVFRKGTDPSIDSYSAFFDNGRRKATGLADFLQEERVEQVAVLGLATDYCVRATVLDACGLGLGVALVEDGCRGVELHSGDVARAVEEMRDAGASVVSSRELG